MFFVVDKVRLKNKFALMYVIRLISLITGEPNINYPFVVFLFFDIFVSHMDYLFACFYTY